MFKAFPLSRCLLRILLAVTLASGGLIAAPYGPDGMETEWTHPDGAKLPLRDSHWRELPNIPVCAQWLMWGELGKVHQSAANQTPDTVSGKLRAGSVASKDSDIGVGPTHAGESRFEGEIVLRDALSRDFSCQSLDHH